MFEIRLAKYKTDGAGHIQQHQPTSSSLITAVLYRVRLSISEVDRSRTDDSKTCSTVKIGSVVLEIQLLECKTGGAGRSQRHQRASSSLISAVLACLRLSISEVERSRQDESKMCSIDLIGSVVLEIRLCECKTGGAGRSQRHPLASSSLIDAVLDRPRLSISEVERSRQDESKMCSIDLIGSVVLEIRLREYKTGGAGRSQRHPLASSSLIAAVPDRLRLSISEVDR